jgi:hypothetical protein
MLTRASGSRQTYKNNAQVAKAAAQAMSNMAIGAFPDRRNGSNKWCGDADGQLRAGYDSLTVSDFRWHATRGPHGAGGREE